MALVTRVEREHGTEHDREHACSHPSLVVDGTVVLEDSISRVRGQEAPEEREVDGRIPDADVTPVDDATQLALIDEDMAHMEIAMNERSSRARRELLRVFEDPLRRSSTLDSEIGEAVEQFPRPRDTEGHVRTPVRIERQRAFGVNRVSGLRRMEHSEEPGDAGADANPIDGGQAFISRLDAGQDPVAEERPGKQVALPAYEGGSRDESREERTNLRQHAELAVDELHCGQPPREPERPRVLDGPDRIVEAFSEESHGRGVEIRELLHENPPDQRRVDLDVRIPLCHGATVARPAAGRNSGMRTISMTALRRLAIAAQGYAPRARRGTRREVEETIRALSCVQLDSITAVERSHRITLGARVGEYPRETVSYLLGKGRIFEYWAHEACLIPVEEWPLFRAAMANHHPWRGDVIGEHPELADEIRAAVRERGPIASRDFEGQGGGGMWNWKPAKIMLEALWNSGEIVIAGRVSGFQRLYDLAERVIPREVLDAPEPDDATRLRELAVRAVRARGALTESGIVEHWRLRGGTARIRPAVDGLVHDGLLERVRVEDGEADVIVEAGSDLDPPRPTAAALLSPFDNLLWDRPFARRILGFDHLIEVYKPAPERQFGYYVLPFLWRDRIVGRVDLKSERKDGSLVVKALHLERGVRPSGTLDDAFDRALDRLRRTIGLERVVR